jgi:pimeloyl-ACP methyl ester carboxylesterase
MYFQYLDISNIYVRYLGYRILRQSCLADSWITWPSWIWRDSDKPKITSTIKHYTNFISKFIKRLGLDSHSLCIVGNSLGGHIAAEFAINFPVAVHKLVLYAPECNHQKQVHTYPQEPSQPSQPSHLQPCIRYIS